MIFIANYYVVMIFT